ncbi:hypothetical protein I4F81_009876 [Pyropia yezoensis]|uniref:Uncharacterized protein n=1 Tax=Pyropia yezoensis TaxID=2788 RepID=A0ACC3CBN9_PYRYE|nr:hypothetical protein I4F81_009876 [Neopyropia yezoensis]
MHNCRLAVIAALPSVRVLDFVHVRDAPRRMAAAAESIEEVDALEAALKSENLAAVLGRDGGGGGGGDGAAGCAATSSDGADGAAFGGPAAGAGGGGDDGGCFCRSCGGAPGHDGGGDNTHP